MKFSAVYETERFIAFFYKYPVTGLCHLMGSCEHAGEPQGLLLLLLL
jgi:hypothetical protein